MDFPFPSTILFPSFIINVSFYEIIHISIAYLVPILHWPHYYHMMRDDVCHAFSLGSWYSNLASLLSIFPFNLCNTVLIISSIFRVEALLLKGSISLIWVGTMFSDLIDQFCKSSLFDVNIVFVALPSFLCVNIDSLSYSRVTQAYKKM